jgi:hypothetical protein
MGDDIIDAPEPGFGDGDGVWSPDALVDFENDPHIKNLRELVTLMRRLGEAPVPDEALAVLRKWEKKHLSVPGVPRLPLSRPSGLQAAQWAEQVVAALRADEP